MVKAQVNTNGNRGASIERQILKLDAKDSVMGSLRWVNKGKRGEDITRVKGEEENWENGNSEKRKWGGGEKEGE